MLPLDLIRRLCAPALAVLLGACSLPFFSDWDESVGEVDGHMLAQGQAIQLDTVASAGSSGRVSIITGGSGSCTRFGRTVVDWQGGRTVQITPYNENLRSADVCTADFKFFPHVVALNYAAPGMYTVRIRVLLGSGVKQIEKSVRVH